MFRLRGLAALEHRAGNQPAAEQAFAQLVSEVGDSAMYQHAEQIIVDDAPVLFTSHSLSYQLVKPYVKGYVFTPIDIPIERYMWLEGK